MEKIIYNNTIPFKGFKAMAFWPWVFVRNECKERFAVTDSNHEQIHLRQQGEMLLLVFYLWYGIEWFIRWCAYGFNHNMAYKNISFEQEAYQNQNDENYLLQRKHYAFIKYLLKKSYK